MTIRLLHLTPRAFGERSRGGGERFFSEMARALGRRDDVVSTNVVTVLDGAVLKSHDADSGEAMGARQLRQLAAEADVIHVHQMSSPAFDAAVALRKLTGTKLVLTDHGGGWRTPGRLLGRHRLRFVDAMAPVSAWSAADCGWSLRDPTQVLYGGGDHLPEPTGTVEPTDFLFVGRLLPEKGVHNLIAALPEGASLRVVGASVSPAYLGNLRGLTQGKNVEFAVDAPETSLAAFYRAAQYTVLPSLQWLNGRYIKRPELMGLVVFESFHNGTPAIGSNVSGLAEVLTVNGMPIVEPDLPSLREALAAHYGDASKRAELAGRAVRAAPTVTWAGVVDRCVELYRRIL